MILFLFVVVLVVLLGMQYRKESFRTKKMSIYDSFMSASPMNIIDGIHSRIHPFIPYKKQYFKLKRYLRYR